MMFRQKTVGHGKILARIDKAGDERMGSELRNAKTDLEP
jgi:hypothetical protein